MSEYGSVLAKKRLIYAIIALGFFLFLLIIRLFIVQIIDGRNLSKKAVEQWMRDIPLSALRGTIYDRNGVVLASSYTTYDVYIRPNSISQKEKALNFLSEILELNIDVLKEKIYDTKTSEYVIKKQIDTEIAEEIKNSGLEGVYLSENSSREYLYDNLLCQILGYCNSDGDGQSGLEAFYNKYLSGVDGVLVAETDNAGRQLEGTSVSYIPSIAGFNLSTTIDYNIQVIVERVLADLTNEQNPKSATAIVMDPKTGEILALGITPSFDLNNVPRDDIEKLMQLSRNSAIQDSYEPGSTFKIITGAIAMQLGIINENSYFYCPGYRIVNGVKINCARHSGHGSQSLEQGFMNSCNCVFMDIVLKIGLDRFYNELKRFSIGSTLPIDFFSPSSGILMDKSLVTSSDLARMGFGQSIAVSPLQLISAVSGIVNDGLFMRPHFIKEITDNEQNIVYIQNSSVYSRVVSVDVSKRIKKMLESVVAKGGGKKAQIDGYKIGGKTGTAQKYENGKIAEGKYIASFIGILPADNPEYVVLVIADEPQGSYYGATAAAPYAKLIMEGIIKYMDIERSEPLQEKHYVDMPNLLGMTQTEAISLLAGLGLYYIVEGASGVVSSQIPSAGSKIEVGDIVLVRMNQ